MACHHDGLVLTERDGKLLAAHLLWVDTVRKARNDPDWTPSEIDLIKSRLFWWIRSGHEPLGYRPPTAYSCPWYELIMEEGNHHVREMWTEGETAYVAQCPYEIRSRHADGSMILGFGPYRFRAFRDAEMSAKQIATINPHLDFFEVYGRHLEALRAEPDKGWWITRRKDLEMEVPVPK